MSEPLPHTPADFGSLARAHASTSEVEALARLFDRGPVAVLTGAGISTESGIPDYRGPETRRRARNPMLYREFLRSAAARQRYWARSMLGWPRFARAKPNAGHAAITKLATAGLIPGLVTQNVDGLHGDAGTRPVELHGALREAICLSCQRLTPRAQLQAELEAQNPAFVAHSAELAPDGDSDFEDDRLDTFQVVDCECGGALKPHVVFFGENVPPARVAQAMAQVQASSALLVVGSSLAVYSGLRFVHAAQKLGVPIAIVTYGETRGDPAATLRIDAGAGLTLTRLVDKLGL
jgi:NAD-dependent SIR2 family protein deacetylase